MKSLAPRSLAFSLLLCGWCLPPIPGSAEDTTGLAGRFQDQIDAYHADSEKNGETLRLVYFHPQDNPPQANYEDRIDRIAKDMQTFFHEEMTKLGFRSPPLPLELQEDGRVVIHVVKGSGASDEYSYSSGPRVKREVQKALAGTVDFHSDFVLVISGLCQKRGKNDYSFHAPYYGDAGSNHVWGLCYAADCEILDPLLLSKEKDKESMKFWEHNGDFEMSVARFNSWYLGGIVHEMGHGLSLPHNGELPEQRAANGKALMGGGNHSYGDDRWGGGKGSFLTLASGLRLAAHPLFTQSDRDRFEPPSSSCHSLSARSDGKRLTIEGTLTSSPPPLAVIAYSDPPGKDGYNALTWIGEIDENNRFKIEVETHTPGLHDLRLAFLHVNGAVGRAGSRYFVDEKGHPDAATLNTRLQTHEIRQDLLSGETELAREKIDSFLSTDPDPILVRWLQHLRSLTDPPEPIEAATAKGDSLFLSDAIWEKAKVGWGAPARNQYYIGREVRNAVLLELGGQFYEKGLYAHAPSVYEFDLGGKWKTFEATVGLQGGVGPMGRSRFLVKGDGELLFSTLALRGSETREVRVDVSGVNKLVLEVESTIEGNPQCWSVWGAPRVSR